MRARSARSAPGCPRAARAAAAARRRPTTVARAARRRNLPSAARLPSSSLLVATSTMLCLSSFGSRNASPFCSAREYWPISMQQRAPSRASSISASGLFASRAPLASATKGEPDVCSARAAISCPVPGSPRINTGRRAASSSSSAFSVSRIGALVPSAASETRRGSFAAAVLNARAIVASSFDRPIGFSRKSNAPMLRRLDGGLDRAVAGHHDDRHRQQRIRAPFAQQRDAVGVRHPDVEQHERGLLALPVRARFARVLGERDAIALVLQDLRQQLADADLVVDDQDFPGCAIIGSILSLTRASGPAASAGK